MDAKIILGRILQRLIDEGQAQVPPLNVFGFIALKQNAVVVTRQTGQDTSIPFQRLIAAIEVYQQNPALYDQTPTALRSFGFTHITSPIFTLLHLLPKGAYE
jgi:hypothetical protein